MKNLEQKFQLGLSVTICVLAFVIATAQTIIADGFHPFLLAFWGMGIATTILVKISYNELKEKEK